MTITLAQFAKTPALGRVKTRMQPLLSPEQSLQLHEALVRHCFEQLHDLPQVHYQLWYAGESEHPLWRELAGKGADLVAQQGAGLGERMLSSCQVSLKTPEDRLIIVGSDCPAVTANTVTLALDALASDADVVLVPADDGGYVMMALRRYDGHLFADVPWGSSKVLSRTLQRIEELNWRVKLLDSQPDIDEPQDLHHLSTFGVVEQLTEALRGDLQRQNLLALPR